MTGVTAATAGQGISDDHRARVDERFGRDVSKAPPQFGDDPEKSASGRGAFEVQEGQRRDGSSGRAPKRRRNRPHSASRPPAIDSEPAGSGTEGVAA